MYLIYIIFLNNCNSHKFKNKNLIVNKAQISIFKEFRSIIRKKAFVWQRYNFVLYNSFKKAFCKPIFILKIDKKYFKNYFYIGVNQQKVFSEN